MVPTVTNRRPVVHRAPTGRSYRGASIHASAGVHERVCELLDHALSPGALVCDLGAGSGALGLRLSDSGLDVTAVDVDTTAMASDLRTVELDALDSALTDRFAGAFDAVCAVELAEHVSDPLALCRQAAALLAPTGLFVLSTPNVTHPYSRAKFAATGHFLLFDDEMYWTTGHRNPLPLWLLTQHLRAAGFDHIEHGYAGRFDFDGVRAIARKAASVLQRRGRAELGTTEDGSSLLVMSRLAIASPDSARGPV